MKSRTRRLINAKALAIVRLAYQISGEGIKGLTPEHIRRIEGSHLPINQAVLKLYAKAIGISLTDLIEKVDFNIDYLESEGK